MGTMSMNTAMHLFYAFILNLLLKNNQLCAKHVMLAKKSPCRVVVKVIYDGFIIDKMPQIIQTL